MNPSTASIVIPVWNGQRQLPYCLNSVLKQDYPAELIIIDDGSTDQSLRVLKNIVGDNQNVKILIHTENQGVGKTLNEGIRQATGEYLLILHQDCEILDADFLGEAVRIMSSNGNIAAVTGRRTYRLGQLEENEKLFLVANGHLADLEDATDGIEEVPFIEHKCDVFRRDMLESIGGFPGTRFRSSGEDQVVSSRLRASGYKLVRAGNITYNLSFGSRESSIEGILRKTWTYGKTQAGVILSERASAFNGISRNRRFLHRMINRLEMVLSAGLVVSGAILCLISPWFIFLPIAVVGARLVTYATRLRRVNGKIRLASFGPFLDLVYSIAFVMGLATRIIGQQL